LGCGGGLGLFGDRFSPVLVLGDFYGFLPFVIGIVGDVFDKRVD